MIADLEGCKMSDWRNEWIVLDGIAFMEKTQKIDGSEIEMRLNFIPVQYKNMSRKVLARTSKFYNPLTTVEILTMHPQKGTITMF